MLWKEKGPAPCKRLAPMITPRQVADSLWLGGYGKLMLKRFNAFLKAHPRAHYLILIGILCVTALVQWLLPDPISGFGATIIALARNASLGQAQQQLRLDVRRMAWSTFDAKPLCR